MSEKILTNIDNKLTVVINLLSHQILHNKPKNEQAMILHNIGLNSTEIGKILGTSSGTVRAQIHQNKKNGGKKHGKK